MLTHTTKKTPAAASVASAPSAASAADFARLARRAPLPLFAEWFADAAKAGIPQPEAMTLATAGADHKPRARTVLLKHFSKNGFVFFTNRESRKAAALTQNPRAALLFYWQKIGRQILLEGKVKPLPRAQAATYFHTRPRLSKIHAWTSAQSRPVLSPAALHLAAGEMEQHFAGREPPLPPHWGGFILAPARIEFWQEGEFRLHHRLEFARRGQKWRASFLQP